MLDMTEVEVYSHLILQKNIASLKQLYGKGETHECRLIIHNILLQLISRFNQKTLEKVNLHANFCLAFAEFWQIGKFTYDKVECNFNFWNLAQGSVSLSDDCFFFVFPALKTDPFY